MGCPAKGQVTGFEARIPAPGKGCAGKHGQISNTPAKAGRKDLAETLMIMGKFPLRRYCSHRSNIYRLRCTSIPGMNYSVPGQHSAICTRPHRPADNLACQSSNRNPDKPPGCSLEPAPSGVKILNSTCFFLKCNRRVNLADLCSASTQTGSCECPQMDC